ncbi:Putative acyl-CoA synthetase YngI [Geodia barretti]|uniref:Medium-chain acyl-CoA ligase ACSF2, mitochondrial n=1 Tax=Geodia barretti TaxID=519541 RepID=A0AA35TTE7_GEOBA|nr:Putative acyl-CoA synthetase YngI [Geodia barretti]
MVGMDAFNSRFRRFRRLARDLLVVVAAITAVVAIVFLLNLWLTDPDRTNADIGRISDIVGIVQLSAAAVIIVAGGVFAYRKLQLFRDFEPHLTVTQSATHRTVGTQYVHVAVTATLHNSSKVRVEIRESFFRLHQIQPLNDEYIEALYEAAFNSEKHTDIDWPVLDEAFHRLGPNELVIEPGEYHNEPCAAVADSIDTRLPIGDILDQQTDRFPDRDALVHTATGARFNYREFHAEVERVARGLLSIGIAKGEHVGIWATNYTEWVLAQFATAKIGAVLVTVNPAYRTHELAYVLEQRRLAPSS